MSALTFRNESDSIPRLAIYKKSYARPSLGLTAWEVVAPTRGGKCVVEVPVTYSVYISTGDENDPYGGCASKSIVLPTFTATIYVVAQATDDRSGYVPDVLLDADERVENEIHIENGFGRGVWGHIVKDGRDIYPPQIITPGNVLMAEAQTSFWIAHISEYVRKGSRLVDGELSLTATEMTPGQTLVVTGSIMGGFQFSIA
jgi:hypothetical protein